MTVQCCVCGKVRKENGSWCQEDIPEEEMESVSHSYCPSCLEGALREIRQQKGDSNAQQVP